MTRCAAFARRTAGLCALAVCALAAVPGIASAGVTIDINAPQGTYEVGQPVTIDYTCASTNPDFPITQCILEGPSGTLVPGTQLDTSTPGEFVVGVSVSNGEPPFGGSTFIFVYHVVAAEPPTVTITTPANGARYSALATLFRPVRASYSCSDAVSGIESCSGTRPDGARLNTFFTALGRHSFTVTARDRAGNTTTVTHTYTVTL